MAQETPISGPLVPPVSEAPQRLDPQFVPLQRVIGSISTGILSLLMLVGVVIVWLTSRQPGWMVLVLTTTCLLTVIALVWFTQAWPVIEYRRTSYLLDDDGIEIRAGVFWRAVTSVPRSRVQHIDVAQGPLERSYGLARLIIYTAGTEHSRVELAGLNHGVALRLREYLLPRGSDDAV